MASELGEWLSCPDCDGTGDVGVLAHETEMVLECYGCGRIAEISLDDGFTMGSRPSDESGADSQPTNSRPARGDRSPDH